MNSTKAIKDRISAEGTITTTLAVWDGAPAIFSERAPDEFLATQSLPCLVIAAPTEDVDASTFSETIRAIAQDVRIYGKDSGSTLDLDEIGRAIRDLFHARAAEIVVDGGKANTATATGPVGAPTTDPSLIGRRVSVRLELQEN